MILVTVGVAGPSFSRLVREVDRLAGIGELDDVFVQIGTSEHEPTHCRYERFLSPRSFLELLEPAEFVITHAGCGTLNTCFAHGKKTIVVPRLARFHEAPDDHQREVVALLEELDAVLAVHDIRDLASRVRELRNWRPRLPPATLPTTAMQVLRSYLDSELGGELT